MNSSIGWNSIIDRVIEIVHTYVNEKKNQDICLVEQNRYSKGVNNEYDNILNLIKQLDIIIDEIDNEIKPFWLKISKEGKRSFYELLFSEYWSFISKQFI